METKCEGVWIKWHTKFWRHCRVRVLVGDLSSSVDMATIPAVAAALTMRSLGGFTHINPSSTRSNLVVLSFRNSPWTALRGLHLMPSRRLSAFNRNDLHLNWSHRAMQAQQSSSIADSDDRTAVPRNAEDDKTGKDQETSAKIEEEAEEDDFELEKGYKMVRVCDRLIEVFMVEKPKPSDWRKLLAFSVEWSKIRPHLYKRCKVRADAEEDLEKKQSLLKLGRKLKEVDDDMQRHDELVKEIRENPAEIDAIVARRRKDFTGEFFEHLHVVAESYYNNLEQRDELARLGAKCLAAVQAYDNASTDTEALKAAQFKFDDILNSPSLEAACKKIDNLARRKELDSTLMLLITKAWASAKESTMMKEEVKDIMYHLYMVARGNLQRLVPKEVRILKHLLTLEDPQERFAALAEAFSPGDELEAKNVDTLYTTPSKLHKWIKTVLDAYYTNRERTLIREAKQLMNPVVIKRLEILKEIVEDEYM